MIWQFFRFVFTKTLFRFKHLSKNVCLRSNTQFVRSTIRLNLQLRIIWFIIWIHMNSNQNEYSISVPQNWKSFVFSKKSVLIPMLRSAWKSEDQFRVLLNKQAGSIQNSLISNQNFNLKRFLKDSGKSCWRDKFALVLHDHLCSHLS